MFPKTAHKSAAQQLKLPEHYDIIAASVMGFHLADPDDVTAELGKRNIQAINMTDESDVAELEDAIMQQSRTITLPQGWFVVGMGDPSDEWEGNDQLSWGLVDLSQCGGLHPDANKGEQSCS